MVNVTNSNELLQAYGKLGTCYLVAPKVKPSTDDILHELEEVLISNVDSGTTSLQEASNILGLTQHLLLA